MNYWLLKSEPQVYSIADLRREQQAIWDGVRNYQARNFLKQMELGDLAFFYHSNIKPPAIVGLAKIIATQVVDPTQFDPKTPYYDRKATLEVPRWFTVKIEFERELSRSITLGELKGLFTGDELLLVKPGSRLSVMPVLDRVAETILNLT